jgi:GxxExxY protein
MPLEIPKSTELVATRILDAAFVVHRELGPGLLESIYEACLCDELLQAGIEFERQVILPVHYKGRLLDAGLRLDIFVAGLVIVEIKAIDKLLPVHKAQLMTYLKLTGARLGLLINFNEALLKDGIRRVAL